MLLKCLYATPARVEIDEFQRAAAGVLRPEVGVRVCDAWLRVEVEGLGFGVWGLGLRIWV
jgi:hypothetical protein